MFKVDPVLKIWMREIRPGATTLGDVHPALANYDRFQAIIQQIKATMSPAGTDIRGVKRLEQIEQATCNEEEQYIQGIWDDSTEDNQMVVCLFKAQARVLASSISFEADLSFKRIDSRGCNEFVLARQHPQTKQCWYKQALNAY